MMGALLTILQNAGMEPCQPWPRYILDRAQWAALTDTLRGTAAVFLAAWADATQVTALFDERESGTMVLASVAVEAGSYPALSGIFPAAAWHERHIRDLWGHTAQGGTDPRPWLDHGAWPVTHPLALRPGPAQHAPEPPEFQEVAGDALMQVPIGPLAAGIGEAAHLRLTVDGDRVVQAESRLGYTHKGTLALMRGKSVRTAARFAARLSGDATVGHSTAFACAAEAALGVQPPPRAIALRDLMGVLERIVTHLDDLTSLGRLAGADALHDRCGLHQEQMRRALGAAFGHRLMMDCVVPGGVAVDLSPTGPAVLRQVLASLRDEVPEIRRLLTGNVIAARLTRLGLTPPALAAGLGAAHTAGDAAARTRARLHAIASGITDATALLTRLRQEDLAPGALTVALPTDSGEGLGHAMSTRGVIWHWLRLDHGQITAVFPRDPGWSLWPLAETVLKGASAGDVAMICNSLGLPASGMDL